MREGMLRVAPRPHLSEGGLMRCRHNAPRACGRRRSRGARLRAPCRTFDEIGRVRFETTCDARGRPARERELGESGRAVRDDEVFEDGSRKAYSR